MSWWRLGAVFAAAMTLAIGLWCGAGVLVHRAWRVEVMSAVDRPVLSYVADRRSPGWNTTMRVVTEFGGTNLLGLATIAVGGWALVRTGDHRHTVYLALTLAGATLSNQAIKLLVARPRPPLGVMDVGGYAWPSGHATLATAMLPAFVIVVVHALRVRRTYWLWAAAASLALLVAFSRVYLGVHYATDVVSGAALGAFWAAACAVAVASAPWRVPASAASPAYCALSRRYILRSRRRRRGRVV